MSNGKPVGILRKDQDRFGEPFRFLNGTFFCKVSAADTQGKICIFDTFRTIRGEPPLHYHHAQDEWFCVMEGEFEVRIGDATYRLGVGDSVFGPRGTPHAFANVTETGRLMITFFPAGSMEAFFRDGSEHSPLTPQQFATLSEEHRMTVVGPPLLYT